MMAMVRRLLGISTKNTTDLKQAAKEARQLSRMARNERTDKLFQTLISEVRK